LTRSEQKSLRYQAPSLVRRGFRLLEQVAPPLAVRLAIWMFCKPKRRTSRPEEVSILRTAGRRTLKIARQKLVVHSWGEGPLIIFHHGWSGSGAQMAPLADRIASAGYRVAVVDARGHGQSPGLQATLPWMGSDLHEIGRQLGPVHALIGHSMGAMICARAMQLGLECERVIMIAAPAEIMPYLRFFQKVFGISEATVDGMLSVLHSRFKLSPADATAERLAAGRTEPLLILHDHEDPDVPLRHPQAWARTWPGCRLEMTKGLGHRRILRDERVAAAVSAFLKARPRAAGDVPPLNP
jgi:pimeloyl-ACP methyl ester carboxylesterase